MKIALIVTLLAAFLIFSSFVSRAIERLGRSKSVTLYRVKYISKTVRLVATILFFILLFLVLGIEYSQVSLFLSSVFAVIGIALFAQWSILSNITASLIIFFVFPYRVGDRVKVVDGDDDICGRIEEISLFHVIIKRNGDLITYPNSLILQKPVVKMAGQCPPEEHKDPQKEQKARKDGQDTAKDEEASA
ncbi:MAG TPA: mechanosensitive ion channel protein MscS [Porticoccaceae bacterium]|nr:mechanosensitive ion channel protein MscS [Porticoccaceae bacterium]HCO58825.1 mechanosensitive ion channel protein MscS [Porticoccaceae bacterium]